MSFQVWETIDYKMVSLRLLHGLFPVFVLPESYYLRDVFYLSHDSISHYNPMKSNLPLLILIHF